VRKIVSNNNQLIISTSVFITNPKGAALRQDEIYAWAITFTMLYECMLLYTLVASIHNYRDDGIRSESYSHFYQIKPIKQLLIFTLTKRFVTDIYLRFQICTKILKLTPRAYLQKWF